MEAGKDLQGTLYLLLALVGFIPILLTRGIARFFFIILAVLFAAHGIRLLNFEKKRVEQYIKKKNKKLGFALIILTPFYAIMTLNDYINGNEMFPISISLFFLFLVLGIIYLFGPEE